MSRRAQGRARAPDGSVYALVTIGPKRAAGRALKWLAAEDLATAREWAGALQELVDALRSSEIDDKLTLSVQVGADDPEHGARSCRCCQAARRHEGRADRERRPREGVAVNPTARGAAHGARVQPRGVPE